MKNVARPQISETEEKLMLLEQHVQNLRALRFAHSLGYCAKAIGIIVASAFVGRPGTTATHTSNHTEN